MTSYDRPWLLSTAVQCIAPAYNEMAQVTKFTRIDMCEKNNSKLVLYKRQRMTSQPKEIHSMSSTSCKNKLRYVIQLSSKRLCKLKPLRLTGDIAQLLFKGQSIDNDMLY